MREGKPSNATIPGPSARVRFARRASATAAQLKAAIDAMLLGLLRRTDLDEIASEYYAESAEPWIDHPYELDGEKVVADHLAKLVDGCELIDLCAGAGREARIFREAGFKVTAVERDRRLCELARADGLVHDYGPVIQGDVRSFDLSRRFDVVYLSPWMYGTFSGRRERMRVLETMARLVAPNGVAVIPVQIRAPEARGARYAHKLSRFVARVTGGNIDVEVGDRFIWPILMHHFTDDEVRTETREARFDVVDSLDVGAPPLRVFFLKHAGFA